MSQIKVLDLTFAYEGSFENVFENVSFTIDSNWKLGLVGRNGRGKTTLLKLFMNEYEYKGNIIKSIDLDYFPYEINNPKRRVMDIFYEMNPNTEEWKVEKEISLLDLKENILEENFDDLSQGEKTKLLLAFLFSKENNFLLIDEPTNHLDVKGKEVLAKYLGSKKSFILVSHDRKFIDSSVDYIMSINKADIDIQKGNFSSFMENKTKKDNFEIMENNKLKKEITKLEKSARRTAAWSDKIEGSKIGQHVYDRGFVGAQSARMMKRSKNLENRKGKAIEEKKSLLKNIENYDDLAIRSLDFHKDVFVSFKDLSISYENKSIFSGVSFSVNKGERVALVGKNGSGKSSILKLIMGENISFTGEFSVAKGIKISYIMQDTSGLKGNLKEFSFENNIDETLFKAILRKLDFSREQFDKNIENYSQGQKKKVLIAKSLSEEANLYIWDEPLNYIDVFSRIQIEKVIEEYKPTIIFVDHDKAFVDNIATKKILIDDYV